MPDYLVSIPDLPGHGAEYTLDHAEDKAVWQDPLDEFGMDVRLTDELEMKVRLAPADGGCLLRGKITGTVVMPCLRCAEDTRIDLDYDFEDFEQLLPELDEDEILHPGTNARNQDQGGTDDFYSDQLDANRIVFRDGVPCVDLAAVAWEEFALALPSAPLCQQNCKGLCAGCGANLNDGQCACHKEDGDPRMSILRGLVIEPKIKK